MKQRSTHGPSPPRKAARPEEGIGQMTMFKLMTFAVVALSVIALGLVSDSRVASYLSGGGPASPEPLSLNKTDPNQQALIAARSKFESAGVEYVGDIPLVVTTLYFGDMQTETYFGDNANRNDRWEHLQEWVKSFEHVSHIHITENNWHDYILPEVPLPALVKYSLENITADRPAGLSSTHISDYLRGYMLYHYGGWYMDIKWPRPASAGGLALDIQADLEDLAHYPSKMLLGMPESLHPDNIGCVEGSCQALGACSEDEDPKAFCQDVGKNAQHLIANAALASRPGNLILQEYIRIASLRLDSVYEEVVSHPAPRHSCCRTEDEAAGSGYPIMYTELWGSLLHPIEYRYRHMDPLLRKPGGFLDYFVRDDSFLKNPLTFRWTSLVSDQAHYAYDYLVHKFHYHLN